MEVMSYDEYMAAAVDDAVTIQAYVQAKQSYYAEQGTATVYLQDQDGAYFAYDAACSQEDYDAMTEGTLVQVSGYKAEWSGEIEIMDGTLSLVEGGDTFVAEPLDATSLLGTEELIDHQNEKVSFTGLTVAPSTDANGNEAAFLYNWDGSGTQGGRRVLQRDRGRQRGSAQLPGGVLPVRQRHRGLQGGGGPGSGPDHRLRGLPVLV